MTHYATIADAPAGILSGWLYVPYVALDGAQGIETEKRLLTFHSKYAEEGDEPIRLYRDVPSKGFIGVPRAYGLERFPWLAKSDRRVMGEQIAPTPSRPDPNHPAVKEPERQAQFMQDLRSAAREHGSFVAMAATGSGKTVCALDTAAEMGRKTLVLVHLERLRDQWLDEIQTHLGLHRDQIGIVQGKTCEFEGKDFVVGMMPSLSQRMTYPREFYQAFGTVIIDECHRVGAPLLSRCVPLFPAHYRWGLSATPTRKDGLDKAVFYHIGPIRVRSEATALDCTVYVQRYRTQRRFFTKSPMSRAKELARDPERNALLVSLIKRNYTIGRQMLVIGKYVDHLQLLMDACQAEGIPAEDMGQFTGERIVRQWQQTPKGPKLISEKRVKVKPEEYERIKRDSRIVFATYGMFKEGIDVPRLDCGIDVLPQSEATQVIGRIRRPMADKPQPYWITILDEACPISRRQFEKRRLDYVSSGCRLVEITN